MSYSLCEGLRIYFNTVFLAVIELFAWTVGTMGISAAMVNTIFRVYLKNKFSINAPVLCYHSCSIAYRAVSPCCKRCLYNLHDFYLFHIFLLNNSDIELNIFGRLTSFKSASDSKSLLYSLDLIITSFLCFEPPLW